MSDSTPEARAEPTPITAGSQGLGRWAHFPVHRPWVNFWLSVAVGVVVYAASGWLLDPPVRFLLAWTTGVAVRLLASWAVILRSDPASSAAHADVDDPGRAGLLVTAIAASLASLSGAVFVLGEPGSGPHAVGDIALALLAITGGWLLLHTGYAFHYARLYYDDVPGGLRFPDRPPDDLDFAYFSFGVGMTFQVGDVVTASRPLRRAVLGHALLSFLYNTAILALTINIVAGRL